MEMNLSWNLWKLFGKVKLSSNWPCVEIATDKRSIFSIKYIMINCETMFRKQI